MICHVEGCKEHAKQVASRPFVHYDPRTGRKTQVFFRIYSCADHWPKKVSARRG